MGGRGAGASLCHSWDGEGDFGAGQSSGCRKTKAPCRGRATAALCAPDGTQTVGRSGAAWWYICWQRWVVVCALGAACVRLRAMGGMFTRARLWDAA